MKLYTFHKEGNANAVIFQVRAEDHIQAIMKAGVAPETPFYSETLTVELEIEYSSDFHARSVRKVIIELSDLDRRKIKAAQKVLSEDGSTLSGGSFVFTPTSEIKYAGDDFIPGTHEFVVGVAGAMYRAYDDSDNACYFETESFKL